MTMIHMETELVYEQGRKMVYLASEMLTQSERLKFALSDLRMAWSGSGVATQLNELDRLIKALLSHAQQLDDLGKKVIREVDEWIHADRTESAYMSALKDTIGLSTGDVTKAVAGVALAATLRWTAKRPASIVFTGPNWMRKAIGINEMIRVIKPSTLAKGMAIVGAAESVVAGGGAAMDAFAEFRHEDAARAVSAAAVDGSFRTAIAAVGAVGIPLALGAIVGAVGLPVVAAGAVVVGGSVLLGLAYSKLVEAPVWELWKQSTLRTEVIETGKRSIDRVSNYVGNLKDRAVRGVNDAFLNFIKDITSSPSPSPISAQP